MAQSRSSVVALPWWFGVVLAIAVFALTRYGLLALGPADGPAHAVFRGFANMAWVFVFLSIVALFRRRMRSRLLDHQRDLESIRATRPAN